MPVPKMLAALARRFIESRFKTWGVQFETSLPPEFYITKHAEQRLHERVGMKAEKIPRLVVKAYYGKIVSTSQLKRAMARNEYFYGGGRIARELMGKIYVFAYGRSRGPLPAQKILVTVI